MELIKRGWIWVLAILVVAGALAAFHLGKKTDPDYFTAKVEKGDIRQVIEATGTINPVTSVQVGSQVSRMISKLCVDFNSKGPYCQHYFLHKFRHTFATEHLRHGVDIRTLQNWMGHRDIKSTMVYLKGVQPKDALAKVNAGPVAAYVAT